MKILQLFDPASSTYSYLLWDARTREALLIDSVKEQVDRDIEVITTMDLKLKYTLETHIHADHITGAGELRDRLGSKAAVHVNSRADCADILLQEDDVLRLGNERVHVLFTPGHTNTDISYRISDAVFTGDALLIDGCGRTDFQSGDAATLYESIIGKLFTLPENTVVYPGHDYNGRVNSTIRREKEKNSRLGGGRSKLAFVDIMNGLKLSAPKQIEVAVPTNQQCGVLGEL